MNKKPKDQEETDTTDQGLVIRKPSWNEIFHDLDETAKPQKKIPLRDRVRRPKKK